MVFEKAKLYMRGALSNLPIEGCKKEEENSGSKQLVRSVACLHNQTSRSSWSETDGERQTSTTCVHICVLSSPTPGILKNLMMSFSRLSAFADVTFSYLSLSAGLAVHWLPSRSTVLALSYVVDL